MSDQCDALTISIAALCQLVMGDATLEETLRRVADLANETISGSDMVSVALVVEGRHRTVACTDVTAGEIDAQYAGAAATHGILDSLSMPLVVRHVTIGALN